MWQLSFSGLTEIEAKALKSSTKNQLIEEALRRTIGWLPMVHSMIEATPLQEVWSTPLYDRSLNPLKQRTR